MDPLLVLERRERALQGDLQSLLDAQSAGLIQGLGAAGSDVGGGSEGSSTPTGSKSGRQSSNGGIMPVRQPKRKTVSLRGARRGVLRVMGELADIKIEEVFALAYEIGRREGVLSRIGLWEGRMEKVRRQLEGATIDSEGKGPEEESVEELQTESLSLRTRIQELEDTLLQLHARKRWLDERITEGINKREARLSSYRGALKEVESEVKDFLKRPPILTSAVVLAEDEGPSFLALKPERRTLGMAREWWSREVSALQERKADVEVEKQALEEGKEVWSECITTVNVFEDELRKEMMNNSVQGPESLRRQIGEMEGVMTLLEEKLSMCEERGWKLLVCAIGAELEAFREGKRMLKGVLVEVDPESSQDPFGHGDGDSSKDDDSVNGLRVLNGGLDGNVSDKREPMVESEDDEGPDLAELFVDRGHGHDDDSSYHSAVL